MKLKAINGSFWTQDNIRSVMVHRKEGDEFELDVDTAHEQISLLLCDGRVTVVDDIYVPERAHYRVLRPFAIFTNDGRIERKAGETVELSQRDACEQMVALKVRPLNPEAWFPFKEFQISNKITKMYDKEPGNGNN